MIRARIWVDGRLAAVCRRFGGRLWRPTVAVVRGMAVRGRSRRPSRTGLVRVGGAFGWPDGGSVADGRSQAGSGMARSRARARLNWVSHGQSLGRCRVIRRAERVIRPGRAKNRRRRVLVVTIC